ncbi:MAG: hypothetical protein JNJ60_17540, partial [Rhodocyclaceae bacterium]|nr:hypothetical protein [Rhodocyclaceae bacterium]
PTCAEGVTLVPSGLNPLKHDDVVYRDLDDPHLVSPIIYSTRALDDSDDVQNMLQTVYRLYEEKGIGKEKGVGKEKGGQVRFFLKDKLNPC